MKLPIYMDYHSTTPVDPKVVEAMLPYFGAKFGNPASRQHQFGWIAEEAVENARGLLARGIGGEGREIVFTSGATESNNLAIKGVADALRQKGDHIVTVETEHPSVLDCCRRLEKSGTRITVLPVDGQGLLDPDAVRKALTPRTILVSVMAANNEIGTIHDIGAIGRICRERGVLFHTDGTQASGKIPIDVRAMHVDLLSMSGHKIYGPKGIGLLFVRSAEPRIRLRGLIDGGGHERGMRSGTLNVPGIVGFAAALEVCLQTMSQEAARLSALRDRMIAAWCAELEDVALNGHPSQRLPNNLNVSFLHTDANVLMMSMKEIAVSTGSACSTADPEPSHVLRALRLLPERLHSAIRFGLGRFTTDEEVSYVIERVIEKVKALYELSPSHRARTKAVPQQ